MSTNDLASTEPWRESLERSHDRRALQDRLARVRRWRDRTLVLLFAGLIVVTLAGADLASGQSSHIRAAVAGTQDRLLSVGSSGDDVAVVQRRLGVAADGIFGPRTLHAVHSLQSRSGLAVDGIVGPRTRAALGLGSSVAAAPGAPAATPQTRTSVPTLGKVRDRSPKRSTAGREGTGRSSRGGDSSASAESGPASVPGVLQRIAQCESGGDPSAVGGGGRYRGKYQFDVGTWRSLGGSGDPASASEAEQDRRAAALLSRSGTAPWANCA